MEAPGNRGSSYFVVGLFVSVAIIVACGLVIFMGGSPFLKKETRLNTYFKDSRGLSVGAPVFLSGIEIGYVAKKAFPEKGQGVIVTFTIRDEFLSRVDSETLVEVASAGVLGDKTLMLTQPENVVGQKVQAGDTLQAKKVTEFTEYIEKGGSLFTDLAELVKNLNRLSEDLVKNKNVQDTFQNFEDISERLKRDLDLRGLKKMDAVADRLDRILAKVESGEGTLGALINDAQLHEDLRILLGGAKRSKLIRFVVRKAIADGEAKEQRKRVRGGLHRP